MTSVVREVQKQSEEVSRETNNNWTPLTLSQLRAHGSTRTIRVYADGVYDLFHYGHVEQLKQAKTAFSNVFLVVGVCTDEDTLRYKGRPTVMSSDERVRSVRDCRWVDEVLSHPPFFPSLAFLDSLQVDLMAHDAQPYSSPHAADCYTEFKAADRFLETQREPHVSTTELLQRILRNDAEYRHKKPVTETLCAPHSSSQQL